ncbi:MAG: hypothetical protein MI674_03635 [Cytophagales bacterium]|nr:hypothetical protein [Cytophagales bacterium]
MKKQTRQAQGENMIQNSLVNIFPHQDNLSFDQFAWATLEGLMLLETEEY